MMFLRNILALLVAAHSPSYVNGQLTEPQRVAEHDKRYSRQWPPAQYVPNTEGWKNLMDARFRQVAEVVDRQQRYEAYFQTVNHALLVKNFTEYGFGLTKGPPALSKALKEGIRKEYAAGNYRLESPMNVVDGPRCLFIDRPDLTRRVLNEMQAYTEAWAQMELTPHAAYGFRLYPNTSALYMHVDRVQTHVISLIYHIDSSDDAEPWPIFIEDLHGRTHEVLLEPGDILFYESSKCMHGRPKPLNGTWYSSIFVHYFPTYGWGHVDRISEATYAIPVGWDRAIPEEKKRANKLEMFETSFKESECPNNWCNTEDAIKWTGMKAQEGVLVHPDFTETPFEPKRVPRHFGTHPYSEEL